jgi:SSS family solute:Na+ symporter
MNLSFVDTAVLLVYLGGITLMGLYFARRNVSTDEYFVGGRSFKGWVIGLSLVGTSISSVSFLAYPGDAYKTAYLRMLPNFMLPVAVLIASYVFLPFFRKNYITSAYEYLELRFGPGIRVYGSLAFIATQAMRLASILYLLSLLIQGVTGLSPITAIIVGGVFVAFYTVVGGISAVIWTDVIQTIVLALGGVICLIVVVYNLPGGLGQIFEVAARDGKFGFSELRDGALHPAGWNLSLQSKTATMMLVIGLTNWLYEYSCNQNVIQRYAASKTMHDARTAMWVCAICSIPIWFFFMFLGTALYVYYQEFPTVATAEMLSGARKAEDVLPYFIVRQLPIGMSGLVIAAAVAAAMSSLDSSINAVSTVSIIDIYRRHLAPDRDDRHYLMVARWIGVVAGIVMIVGAIWLSTTDSRTLQHTLTIATSLLTAGLFGLYMLGMLTTRSDGRAVLCAIVATLLFTTWTVLAALYQGQMLPAVMSPLAPLLDVPFDIYYTGVVGNIVMFVVGYVAGRIWFPCHKPLKNLTIWTRADSHDT